MFLFCEQNEARVLINCVLIKSVYISCKLPSVGETDYKRFTRNRLYRRHMKTTNGCVSKRGVWPGRPADWPESKLG